jgi:hypothetical protein
MKTQEVVASKSVINVVLEEETIGLEEVVAVGYGVVKKSDVTGAWLAYLQKIDVSTVKNTFEALQGRAAGVDITSNERPGEVGLFLFEGYAL